MLKTNTFLSLGLLLLLTCCIDRRIIEPASDTVNSNVQQTVNITNTNSNIASHTESLPTKYLACGCGCCGGTTPKKKCLYRSKGDDLKKIIDENEKWQGNICDTVGCSIGIEYRYCD